MTVHFYTTVLAAGRIKILCSNHPIVADRIDWREKVKNAATTPFRVTCVSCLTIWCHEQEMKIEKVRERITELENVK
jgi:hypothetical protein